MNRKRMILEQLKRGEITPVEAAKLLINDEVQFYTPDWVETPLGSKKRMGNNPRKILILCDPSKHMELDSAFSEAQCIYVYRGDSYSCESEKIYRVNPTQEADYVKLFSDISDGMLDFDVILHLWSMDESDVWNPNEIAISILNIGKQVLSITGAKNTQFIYSYGKQDGHNTIVEDAIFAIFKSLKEEATRMIGKTISLDRIAVKHYIQILIEEMNSAEMNKIRYQDGMRYTEQPKEIEASRKVNLILNGGYYLITGGAGALGRALSKDIISEGGKVIWCGRKLRDDIPDGVEYHICDTAEKELVVQMEQTLVSEGKKLSGIFVCAGSINDSLLKNKDLENAKDLVSAKVRSIQNIDEVFSKHPLDFFIAYSSIAAHIPSMGQSDYAYANSYVETYMLNREEMHRKGCRKGKSLCIAWPFFLNGGMKLDDAYIDYLKNSKGIIPLDAKQQYGLIQLMMNYEGVIVPLCGDSHILLGEDKVEEIESRSIDDTENQIDRCETKLKEIAAEILHEDVGRFKTEEKFSQYGFDSITSIEFINAINQFFNIKVMPSILFEYTKFPTLAEYLVENNRDEIRKAVYSENMIHDTQMPLSVVDADSPSEKLDTEDYDGNRLAIVGMAGRFPESDNLEELWDHLVKKHDLVTAVPDNRREIAEYFEGIDNDSHEAFAKYGGFMKTVDTFDEKLFGISRREADYMNPQQRILLETIWNLFENAGYKASDLRGKNIGVFVGTAGSEYSDICQKNEIEITPYSSMGLSHAIDANRISYLFDLRGPSESIDTACSSSLVAMNRAVKAIENGECDAAIVAGVNVILTPSLYVAFDRAGMLSKTGKCSAFDEEANGFVRGEGVGAVYIKPLKKAQENRDYIYGIIRGIGVNHGGDASSLTAPNASAQKQLLTKVYADAKVPFDTVSYIETHGTGTVLGDSVEVNALCSVYRAMGKIDTDRRCGLGSIKTNMGHLETAAGIAGVIKVLLAMKHNLIPGNINFHKQSKMIDLEGTPFYIQKENTCWERERDRFGEVVPRRAGVSSFGFGGTNAHVILEEYEKNRSTSPHCNYIVFPLSAPTIEQLRELIQKLKNYITGHKDVNLHDIAFTLQKGREEFEKRLVVSGTNRQDILSELTAVLNGEENRIVTASSNSKDLDVIEVDGAENREQFEEIIHAWEHGRKINWNLYPTDTDAARIAIPGYEFRKNKHWIKEACTDNVCAKLQCMSRRWTKTEPTVDTVLSKCIILCDTNQKNSCVVSQLLNVNGVVTVDNISTLSSLEEVMIVDIRKDCSNDTFFEDTFKGLKYLLRNVQQVRYVYAFPYDNKDCRMRAEALEGLFHSIYEEYRGGTNTRFGYQVIGYSDISVLNKSRSCENKFIIYKDAVCLEMTIDVIPFEEHEGVKHNRLKDDGRYIVFGGAGGIGKLTVEYLLENTNGHIVIVGRSNSNDAVNTMKEEYGSRIDYLKSDISIYADVQKLREYILTTFGPINGIIHSAGENRDSSFASKKLDDFHSVIQAKVRGCMNIDKVFGSDELDFILMYTSVASYYGNAGQSDYCLANLYMEAYANERQKRVNMGDAYGDTLYIAWPFWKNIGMKTPEYIQKRLYSRFGLLPLEKKMGVGILDSVLRGGKESCGYVYGTKIRLPEEMQRTVSIEHKSHQGITSNSIIKNYIIELLERMVGAEDIELKTTLEELCIDSIIVTNFTDTIQKDIGEIDKTILFECENVGEVVNYMISHYATRFDRLFSSMCDAPRNSEANSDFLTEFSDDINVGEEKYRNTNDEIAIIGYDGRFASADSVNDLWEKLTVGEDLTRSVPHDRWDNSKFFSKKPGEEGKYYCQNAGFMNNVGDFDPLFFHISPKEAELMDPQERLMLEIAWNTVEKSGYNKESITKTLKNEVGVFVGVTTHTYNIIGGEELYKGNPDIAKSESWSIANRISYFMNWKGPSLAVDTACSSSLTALHYACKSLLDGETRMAFVGGANLYLHPMKFIYMSQMRMLSESGISSPFGENADGFVPGEGVGGLLLKTLEQAVKDGDRIVGVIKGSAINHDGMTNGYTVPNVKEQAKVIRYALEKANINPETISYVEAHGTGTRLGDPIEISGLNRAWSGYTNRKHFCSIGSIKGNIGHLEGCAGIASIIKVLLQFEHKQLLPSIHSDKLNTRINFADSPFYVQHELEKWEPTDSKGEVIPRRAAVSSFGAGGTNVHVILEEYKEKDHISDGGLEEKVSVLVLSARNQAQLMVYAKSLLNFLEKHRVDSLEETNDSNNGDSSLELVGMLAELLEVPIDALDTDESLENFGMDRVGLEIFKQSIATRVDEDLGIENIALDWSLAEIRSRCLNKQEKSEAEYIYDIRFPDFVYSVNTREKFDERLAIHACGLNDIEIALRQYINNSCIFEGNAISYNSKKMSLNDLPSWIDCGINEWGNSTTNLIDIPTYPFGNNCYWTPVLKEDTKIPQCNSIIDENISSFKKQVFRKKLSAESFYLSDHIINGESVLPGVFYLQMAHEASKRSFEVNNVILRDITWKKPLKVQEEIQTTIVLTNTDHGCNYEILSDGNVHMQGKSVPAQCIEARKLDISEIRKKCHNKVLSEKLYQDFEATGIHYGESFRGVKNIIYGNNEILAEIDLPDCPAELNEYPLHPSILDAALQTTAVINEIYPGNENKVVLPFSVKEFCVCEPLQKQCYVYVHSVKKELNMIQCDIQIMGKNGSELAYFSEFTFRAIETESKLDLKTGETYLYTTVWKPEKVAETTNGKGTIVIFYDGDKFNEAAFNGKRIVMVRSRDEYSRISRNEFQIRTTEENDYDKLLRELIDEGITDFGILHFWSDRFDEINQKSYIDYIQYGIQSIFNICKAIINQRNDLCIKLFIVNRLKTGYLNPFFTSIAGFLKTIHLEHGNIRVKSIIIDKTDNTYWDKLNLELESETTSIEIRYKDGLREVKGVERINISENENVGLESPGNVYLITGALGGLANLLISKICSLSKDAKFIFTDILPSGIQSSELVANVESRGNEAIYIPADLTRIDQVEQVVKLGMQRFTYITKLIHTAGIIHDGVFRKKKFDLLKKVMAPKVYGTVNLDQATKDIHLKSFVVFSSLAAFGNVGQCDYSFANDFLVRFGEQRNIQRKEGRRFGETLVMNWPLWENGGMKTDEQTEQLFQHFGMQSLDTESGLTALDISMRNNISPVIVCKGDEKRIFQKLTSMFMLRNDIVGKKDEGDFSTEIKQIFTCEVKDIICELLKIQEDIDLSVDISDYGFDSVSITELVNRINERYGFDLLPTNVFEYNTIQKFIDWIYELNYKKLYEYYERIEGIKRENVLLEFGKDEEQKEDDDTSSISISDGEAIAVIGMSCKFPGANNIYEFWENLVDNRVINSEIPSDRWDWRKIYGDSHTEPNKTYAKTAAFVNDIEMFDEELFGITKREAIYMDPVQRMVLEESYRAIEDAGIKHTDLRDSNTGVYIGLVSMEYYEKIASSMEEVDPFLSTGNSRAVTANRISYIYSLRGPSEVIDTACSSSIVAVDRAIDDLHAGKCSLAIVGGVNAILSARVHLAYSRTGMLSQDGRCKTFDDAADGYGRGEGCGIMVLKPLRKAIEDHDPIHCLIIGSSVNHTGHVNNLTTPNPIAQAEVIENAVKRADVPFRSIAYIETHGTGTKLGDPIEISGIINAEKRLNSAGIPHPCVLGALKSNIGHLEGAAGIAGMIKTAEALEHNLIPSNANFHKLNQFIKLNETDFKIAVNNQNFPVIVDENGEQYPRRAGVSSFGFSGVNAHVLMEAYENNSDIADLSNAARVFVLSARNEELLSQYVEVMYKWLRIKMSEMKTTTDWLDRVVYTLQTGKDAQACRVAIVFSGIEELVSKLENFERLGDKQGIYQGKIEKRNKTSIELNSAMDAEQIAKTFVEIAKLEWGKCYLQEPKRIFIPTRPLKRTRCWYEEKDKNQWLGDVIRKRFNIPKEMYTNKVAFENDMTEMEEFNSALVLKAFMEKGYFTKADEVYTLSDLRYRFHITEAYTRLMAELIEILHKSGFVRMDGENIVSTNRVTDIQLDDSNEGIKKFENEHNRIHSHIALLYHCLPHLFDIMEGKTLATDILFPNSSMELVKPVYADNPGANYYNQLVVQAVIAYIEEMHSIDPEREIRILEVGAGTGGTSKEVLKEIANKYSSIRYMYTDMSNAFLNYGRRMYGKKYDFMEFGLLNVEKDPASQGFHSHTYDIIIGANVFHATRNVRSVMSYMEKLLKPSGWLVINEITRIQAFLTSTFGLTEGWWLFEDTDVRLKGGPLLCLDSWKTILLEAGFEFVEGADTFLSKCHVAQDVIIAKNTNDLVPERVDALEMNTRRKSSIDYTEVKEFREDTRIDSLMQLVQKNIVNAISSTLMVEASSIDINEPYNSYGVDSILGAECVNAINRSLGITLDTTELFNRTDIVQLTEYICEQFGEIMVERLGVEVKNSENEISDMLTEFQNGDIEIEDLLDKLETVYG